jgi:hypothetical protein
VLAGSWPAAVATPLWPPPAAPAGRRVDDLEAARRFDLSEDGTLVRGSTT